MDIISISLAIVNAALVVTLIRDVKRTTARKEFWEDKAARWRVLAESWEKTALFWKQETEKWEAIAKRRERIACQWLDADKQDPDAKAP